MKEQEMRQIARLISEVLKDPSGEKTARGVRAEVARLVKRFPLYKDLIKRLQK
jgi:glycine/serine hydroxymethyltransferase